MTSTGSESHAARRSVITRLLHFGLLLVVIHQLVNSNFIEMPLPGNDPDWTYQAHVWVGTTGLCVVLLFWLWSFARGIGDTPLGQLFPWVSRARLKALVADGIATLKEIAALRIPSDRHEALASAFHGIGLLVVTIMATTGALWYFYASGTPYGRPVLGIHRLVANLMWAYLIAHAAIAFVHHLAGSDVLSRMFFAWRRKRA